MSSPQTLKAMIEEYRGLPYDKTRAALNQQALALAEELKLPFYQTDVCYDLIWACAAGDDPAKALPVCARFFALLEEHPGVLRPADTRRCAINAAMVAAHVATSLPQIPLEQCRALMARFHEQVARYGAGERLWRMHESWFCLLTGDLKGAEANLRAFWDTPRDALSDCEACELSNAAEILLGLGDRVTAHQVLRPVLDGAKRCDQQPWSVLSVLIHDELDRGELHSAQRFGRQLSRHSMTGPTDLSYVGALLRLSAHTGPETGLPLLEKGLGWSVGLWDQGLLFDFYRGAWALCEALRAGRARIPLALPRSFPLWQPQYQYDPAELARWFRGQAESIAEKFDKRNGSSYYSRKLTPAVKECCTL